MTEEPRVKGVAFRSIDAVFLELRGPEAHGRARSAMPSELRDAYENGVVLAASWYPIAWYRDAFRAFRAATGEDAELARQIGHACARRDMSSIHKQLFAKIVSPQTLLAMSQRVFNTYYAYGRLEVTSTGRGRARLVGTGCVGFDENMWTEIVGSSTALLEIAGATNVRLRTLSGGRDGDTSIEVEGSWQ